MVRKTITSFVFAGLTAIAHAQISWPAETQQTKPWARWWWEGSAVNKKDLSANLVDYKSAGLGGLELTAIYGVHGYEKQFINFLSPKWMEMLDHTLKEARRLDLGVDLANGTGWPFGGPTITDKYASKTIYYNIYHLYSGQSLSTTSLFYQPQGFARTANNKSLNFQDVKPVISENKNLQDLAIDQIVFPTSLPVKLLMAYNDNGVALNLTEKVSDSGILNWKAPAGTWTLYAIYQGLHGKMVERAAPGGEGYAIDHFSKEALDHYFKRFDDAFRGHDISYIRALFNDSYEVDDSRGQSNWTPDFLSQFQKRRGYDLKNYLYALFQKADSDLNSRVIFDYRSTIGELILENFTQEWKKWGVTKGAIIRNQSHGSPANLLDLYGAIDIPETEGTDILRYKFATSAAHVTGKKLASSESATWLAEHFISSLGDVKKALDLYWLGGVNHIFYHGVCYSPKGAPWPGWLFYAAVHFQQNNPQWKDFHALNEYASRTQSFLQKGKPDDDVLLYYPLADRYSDPGRELLQHFDGMGNEFQGTEFYNLSQWMLSNGYCFDFFSDKQLQQFAFAGKTILTGGCRYQTILLPANEYMSEQSLQKLFDLADQGATILIYKKLPRDVPGFFRLNERRAVFNRLLKRLKFSADSMVQRASVGRGLFLMSSDIDSLLKMARVRTESLQENGLQFIRRKNMDGTTYFFNNRSDTAINNWIPLNAKAVSVALFDAMTGNKGLAEWRTGKNGRMEVLLQLKPFASIILQLFDTKRTGEDFPYIQTLGTPVTIEGKWKLTFLSGGPTIPAPVSLDRPGAWAGPWKMTEGEAYQYFSGTASYSVSFARPPGNYKAWLLDIGRASETAEIVLNGEKIRTLTGPDFTTIISGSAVKENNTLEIIVSNTMANRIMYMDKNQIPWKIFYNTNMPAKEKQFSKNGLLDTSKWDPMMSGLTGGPVTLTGVKEGFIK